MPWDGIYTNVINIPLLLTPHRYENADGLELLFSVAAIYTQYGNDSCNNFFVNLQDKVTGYQQIPYVVLYGRFLQQCSDTCASRGVPILGNLVRNGDNHYVKFYAKSTMQSLQSTYKDRESDLTGKINDLKGKGADSRQVSDLQNKLNSVKNIEDLIKPYLEE